MDRTTRHPARPGRGALSAGGNDDEPPISSRRLFQAHETSDSTLAFHLATGYPCYLAGRGVLPGDRLHLMVALGNAGYAISARWLLFEARSLATSPSVCRHCPSYRFRSRKATRPGSR